MERNCRRENGRYATSSTIGESTKRSRIARPLPNRERSGTIGLYPRHSSLWRGEQHLNLGLHRFQRVDQTAHIDCSHARSMEQQPAFDSNDAKAEHQSFADQALGQISPVVGGMNDEHVASHRYPAEILAQVSQIATENTPALAPEMSPQARRKSGLRGKKPEILFLQQTLHRPVLVWRHYHHIVHRDFDFLPRSQCPV